ncbi:hypothetical protein EV421DRAFT_1908892 [Armillaria borealis]|uniref:Uncharacterized protein n=1 Tax=Armillaria borealis TaxID=47425 RepID=A0AA39J324_9AGAR|nr:hypothetical protein EV421DRAFT_1908892 [Armillaria borealis]
MVLGPRVSKFIPYLSLGVATAAFIFQTTVLYPWHHELDEAFHKLKGEQARMLKDFHDMKLKRFDELERKVIGVERRQDVVEQAAARRL